MNCFLGRSALAATAILLTQAAYAAAHLTVNWESGGDREYDHISNLPLTATTTTTRGSFSSTLLVSDDGHVSLNHSHFNATNPYEAGTAFAQLDTETIAVANFSPNTFVTINFGGVFSNRVQVLDTPPGFMSSVHTDLRLRITSRGQLLDSSSIEMRWGLLNSLDERLGGGSDYSGYEYYASTRTSNAAPSSVSTTVDLYSNLLIAFGAQNVGFSSPQANYYSSFDGYYSGQLIIPIDRNGNAYIDVTMLGGTDSINGNDAGLSIDSSSIGFPFFEINPADLVLNPNGRLVSAVNVSPVPEPSTWLTLILGAIWLNAISCGTRRLSKVHLGRALLRYSSRPRTTATKR